MKNLIINIFFILLLATFTLNCHFLDAQEKQKNLELAQFQTPSASADALAKARISGEMEVQYENNEPGGLTDPNFYKNNWGILSLSLLAFFEVIVRLTPSLKDNSIFNFISTILNSIIPNFRKGGGVH